MKLTSTGERARSRVPLMYKRTVYIFSTNGTPLTTIHFRMDMVNTGATIMKVQKVAIKNQRAGATFFILRVARLKLIAAFLITK